MGVLVLMLMLVQMVALVMKVVCIRVGNGNKDSVPAELDCLNARRHRRPA
jgi:hypothetical protein